MKKTYFALFAASVISTIGLMQNSTATVIASMAISPIVSILFSTLNSRQPFFKKWSMFGAVVLVPIIIGFISNIVRSILAKYKLTRNNYKQRTQELLNKGRDWKSILVANGIIGVLCGILLNLFPNDNVLTAGVSIALTVVPPLCASGIFAGYYVIDRKPETATNIQNALS